MTDKRRLALLRSAVSDLERTGQGHIQWVAGGKTGGYWKLALAKLEDLEEDLKPPKVPALGPVQPGGASLLAMSLTHETHGIPLFPAFDTAWGGGGGVSLIAPESMVVDTKDSSASPGEAIYTTGASKLRLWWAHLDRDWRLGHQFRKGDFIGKTLPIPGKSDHAHIGVNAEALLGKGKQLKYGSTGRGPDYTLGSPPIGVQLAGRW